MEELVAYRQELLSALHSQVTELSRIVAAIPAKTWHLSSGRDAGTAHYLLAHLREVESQEFSSQMCRFLDEDTPRLARFDNSAWMASHYDLAEPTRVILEGFANLRQQELDWLRALHPEGWSRTARHPWWGLHTLQWWVELQLDCTHQHLGELAAFLAV